MACGEAFVDVADEIRPYLNAAGQIGIAQLDQGINQLRYLIERGDVQGISNNFANIGAAGLRNLATTTTDLCLQETFLALAEIDLFIAYIIQFIGDPFEVAEIACKTLDYKAQRINSCNTGACSVFY